MTKQRTPVPWQISDARTTEDTAMIVGGAGFEFGLIADVTEDFDAEFIVRACNAHDDLLEALQAVVAVADRKTDEFDRARAAIAKAKGAT